MSDLFFPKSKNIQSGQIANLNDGLETLELAILFAEDEYCDYTITWIEDDYGTIVWKSPNYD